MTKLPVVSGRDAIRVFLRAGWAYSRTKGSHVILAKPGTRVVLSVPLHDELGRGTLRRLIREAELSVDEFRVMLDSI